MPAAVSLLLMLFEGNHCIDMPVQVEVLTACFLSVEHTEPTAFVRVGMEKRVIFLRLGKFP